MCSQSSQGAGAVIVAVVVGVAVVCWPMCTGTAAGGPKSWGHRADSAAPRVRDFGSAKPGGNLSGSSW